MKVSGFTTVEFRLCNETKLTFLVYITVMKLIFIIKAIS